MNMIEAPSLPGEKIPALNMAQRFDQLTACVQECAKGLDQICDRTPEADNAYDTTLSGNADHLMAELMYVRERILRLAETLGMKA